MALGEDSRLMRVGKRGKPFPRKMKMVENERERERERAGEKGKGREKKLRRGVKVREKRERVSGREQEREKGKDYISLVSHVRPFVQSFSGYRCGLADISAPWKPFSIQSVKSTSKSHTVFHRRGRSRRDRRLHPATVPR